MLDIFENIPEVQTIEYALKRSKYLSLLSIEFDTIIIRANEVEIKHVNKTDIMQQDIKYTQIVHLNYKLTLVDGTKYLLLSSTHVSLNQENVGKVSSHADINNRCTYIRLHSAVARILDILDDCELVKGKVRDYLTIKVFE